MATDAFGGTGALGSDWTVVTGSFNQTGGNCYGNSGGASSVAVWDTEEFGTDHEAWVVLQPRGSGQFVGPSVRASLAAFTCVSIDMGSDGLYLSIMTAGSQSVVSGYPITCPAAGTKVTLRAEGADVILLFDDVVQNTHSGILSGVHLTNTRCGFVAYSSGTTTGASEWGAIALADDSFTLGVDSGSAVAAGQTIALVAADRIAVDSGSAVMQGQEIPFILTNPGTHAEAVFAGQSITLTAPQQLALDAGSAVGQGQTLAFATSLAVTHGQATGQGQAIDLARSMPVTHGEAVFAGQTVTFPVAFALTAGQTVGAGQDINLQYGDSYQLALDHGQGVGEGQDVSLPWINNLTLVVTHAQVVGRGSDVTLSVSGLVTEAAAVRFKALSRQTRFAVRPMGRFTTRLQ